MTLRYLYYGYSASLLMPSLYNFILQRLEFYEKKYPGKTTDESSAPSLDNLKNQIEKDTYLSSISSFLDNPRTKAIDQTPIMCVDTIKGVKKCNDPHNYDHYDHNKYPCGWTGNMNSATIFELKESGEKLLYIEHFNKQIYNCRCLFVFFSPKTHWITYDVFAYRIFYCESSDDMRQKYIVDRAQKNSSIPERFYFPKMRDLLEEHQLTAIKHECDDKSFFVT